MALRSPLRLVAVATAIVVLAAGSVSAAATGDDDSVASTADTPLNVGYFTQWGIYGRSFNVKNLDTSGAAEHLTHIKYAFANVSEDGLCFEDKIPGEGDAWGRLPVASARRAQCGQRRRHVGRAAER